MPLGGEASCGSCGRLVTLRGLDVNQTISFCSDIDSGTSFHVIAPDRSGEILGHFRLVEKLGQGGMGVVYRALDESLQRYVAVKVLRSVDEGGSSSHKEVTRLLDEAISQARLNHPQVVTIYYVGRYGEEPFFAMELLPGPTLEQVLREGPVPYGLVISYAQQVCSALAHASTQGLVHGDIKPSNLLIAGTGRVKLSDFGLAKTEATLPESGLSGTLTYMAPELVSGELPSAQSDMYSLGITLFELTFGRRPFKLAGATLAEQLESQQGVEVEFPEKWPMSVPERWRQLLQRLMSKSPSERFSSYEDLSEELDDLAPVGVTQAGLLTRSLALVVDYGFQWMMMFPMLVVGTLSSAEILYDLLPDYVMPWLDRLGPLALIAPLVPAIYTWMEFRGWRTLGRYLFQLRLVDEHGLPLAQRRRLFRVLLRNSPVWIYSVILVLQSLGLDLLATILSPVDETLLLIDTVPVLGPRRLALHDRLFGSHVVLATKKTSKKS